MRQLWDKINIDFVGKKKVGFLISGTAILLSIGSLIVQGLNFGVDFAGGTEIHYQFNAPQTTTGIRDALKTINMEQSMVQEFGVDGSHREFLIRIDNDVKNLSLQVQKLRDAITEFTPEAKITKFKYDGGEFAYVNFDQKINAPLLYEKLLNLNIDRITLKSVEAFGKSTNNEIRIQFEGVSSKITAALEERFGKDSLQVLRVEVVGPKVGKELQEKGLISVLAAMFFILLYIAFRFDMKFAPGAVIALAHDVIITLGMFSLTQKEFNLPIVAVILAIIGYSLNDTIVVYDRIRDNIDRLKQLNLEQVINQSINQTLSRTILTSLTTLLVTLSLLFLGGSMIHDFAFAMTIGIVVGTYSSIYVASPTIILYNRFFEGRKAS